MKRSLRALRFNANLNSFTRNDPTIRRTLHKLSALIAAFSIAFSAFLLPPSAAAAKQTEIIGPPGSGQFGSSVTVLPNGNIVVTDPLYDAPGAIDAGAVYLYDGATLNLISTLTGSSANDRVGSAGITVLTNGNFVVGSSSWNNGSASAAGAVTFVNGTTGLDGIVSPTNSLVGSTASSSVGVIGGANGVKPLPNGNYVVVATTWRDGAVVNAGAVTWGDGVVGTSGVITASNSIVGTNFSDEVGSGGVTILNSGNYVVVSPSVDNGAATNAGAVTWGNGTTGVTGAVSALNSLVGTTAGDQVGNSGVAALTNGNYVVRSQSWANGAATAAGAVTWVNGATGINGPVSASNSLVGTTAVDQVGSGGVTVLPNGNCVVRSQFWDNGAATNAGAVTWVNGATGINGPVSASNSLVGTTANDLVGSSVVTVLANGNYVIPSPNWDNGAATNAGAVTWVNGATGISGSVSPSNSLIGTTSNDEIGWGLTALANGNYVVQSRLWDNGAVVDVGAVTWGNGATGINGPVTASNSLFGTTASDVVGSGVTALTNGNYVVNSRNWDNGTVANVGAITWADGTSGLTGPVSTANSLVGSVANDAVGNGNLTALTNGNYVVVSQFWNNGPATGAGAVTWGDGQSGTTGIVSASNSLVGTTTNDRVGSFGVTALQNGNYVVRSPIWDNGATVNAGAVTWGSGSTGVSGPVSAANSLVGTSANDSVGQQGAIALSNGNYVITSLNWDGTLANVGAVTWGNGAIGTNGPISSANSLVGTTGSDQIGNGGSGSNGVVELPNGNYAVTSRTWNNGFINDATAITWGNGATGTAGQVDATNSILGNVASPNGILVFASSPTGFRIVVGKRAENIVTVFDPLGPTSAGVEVSGRVLSAEGTGIGRATVVMTDSNGNLRQTITSSFGHYSFEGVAAGETYIISVRSKAFQFEPRVVEVTEDLSGVDFIAAPGSEGGRR